MSDNLSLVAGKNNEQPIWNHPKVKNLGTLRYTRGPKAKKFLHWVIVVGKCNDTASFLWCRSFHSPPFFTLIVIMERP
jgi:hypothetical protein